jgi:hypothetical protein
MSESIVKWKRTLLVSCVALALSLGFTLLLSVYFFSNSWLVTGDTQLTNDGYFAVKATFGLYGQYLFLLFVEYSVILFGIFCAANYFAGTSVLAGVLSSVAGCLLAMIQMVGLKTYVMFDSVDFLETSGVNEEGINVALFYVFGMRVLIFSTILSLLSFNLLRGLSTLTAKD